MEPQPQLLVDLGNLMGRNLSAGKDQQLWQNMMGICCLTSCCPLRVCRCTGHVVDGTNAVDGRRLVCKATVAPLGCEG